MDKKLDIIKDFSNEQLVFKTSQDCGAILKEAREQRNDPLADLSFGRKYATVPTAVLDAWILHEGIDYRKIGKDPEMRKRFMAKLNSREWCGFRTHEGKI